MAIAVGMLSHHFFVEVGTSFKKLCVASSLLCFNWIRTAQVAKYHLFTGSEWEPWKFLFPFVIKIFASCLIFPCLLFFRKSADFNDNPVVGDSSMELVNSVVSLTFDFF